MKSWKSTRGSRGLGAKARDETSAPTQSRLGTVKRHIKKTKSTKKAAQKRLGSIYKAPSSCSISWRHLKYEVPMKKSLRKPGDPKMKSILKDVSGRVAPGDVLAIMGPSGSGKTTMLDVLADRVGTGTLRGQIYINGKPRDSKMNRVAKYVAQHDALLGCFTVLETLKFTAELTFGSDVSPDTKRRMIDSVIDELGLRSCTNTRVGDIFLRGISGGQKRRLSIAIELLGRPAILLLDEPTSGLDSASAYSVMRHIRNLVGIGHAVAVTIHQPSSSVWELFTSVMLLVEGRTVYFGKCEQAIQYFCDLGLKCPNYTNPSDYYLEVVNTDFEDHADVDDLVAQFLASDECHHLIEQIETEREVKDDSGGIEKNAPKRVGIIKEFSVLLHRNFMNNVRNPGIYFARMFLYCAIGTVAGSMYYNVEDGKSNLSSSNTSVLLFFVHAFMMFLSLSVLPFFIEQRAVFIRERANGLIHVAPYCVAQFISCIPMLFIIANLAAVCVTKLSGLKNTITFAIILFSCLTAAESFALVISALISHYIVGIALGSSIFGAMLLCSGMTVTRGMMPFYWVWLYYAGINTYAFEAFMLNQFSNESLIIKAYEMENGDLNTDIAVMWIHVLVFQVSFFIILYYFHTGQK